MRTRVFVIAIAVFFTSCGGVADEAAEQVDEPAPALAAVIVDDPPAGNPVIDTRPIWEGFEATNQDPSTLAAYLHGPLEVYETPESPGPYLTLEHTTILGTVTVLGVVKGPVDGWAEVMLPVRPNGATGWIRADDVSFFVADSEIIVELSDRRLTYVVDGVEVLQTEVGIGSVYNQTPTGHYFVTDNVTLTSPNSPWGPHALGLSARSDTITEFNGGDGIIGIHGTNNPSSIGGNISLGCVRLPNDMITALHEMVAIGTRVDIRA